MVKFIGSVIALIFLSAGSSSQETECSTPANRSGTCIDVKYCPPLLNILKGPRPLPTEHLELLKTSQCGFNGMSPKVCCENEHVTTIIPLISTPLNDTVETPPAPPDVTNHPNLRLLDHDLCGPITQGRIINGNKTGIFDFPWMALIAYQVGSKHEFRCGGSVISKRYVLTAAHCVTHLPDDIVLSGVRLGEHDISKETDCDTDEEGLNVVCAEKYQDFEIESSHYHSDYTLLELQNDIGLIRLTRDADFRPPSVRPICLPIGSAARINSKKVTVTGWGATEIGPRSQDLLQISINVVPNEQCAPVYRNRVAISYKQICAGGTGNTDSCMGDSGGPLQSPNLYNNNPKYVQYGIVSFGPRRCGSEGVPGVYTHLTYYVDWILDTMRS